MFRVAARRSRRFAAGALAALFALGLAGRGVCAMGGGAADSADEHGCCRTGLKAAVPSCCLDAPSSDTPARLSPPAPGLAPLAPAAVLDDIARPPLTLNAPGVFSPTHSPARSPIVLRI